MNDIERKACPFYVKAWHVYTFGKNSQSQFANQLPCTFFFNSRIWQTIQYKSGVCRFVQPAMKAQRALTFPDERSFGSCFCIIIRKRQLQIVREIQLFAC